MKIETLEYEFGKILAETVDYIFSCIDMVDTAIQRKAEKYPLYNHVDYGLRGLYNEWYRKYEEDMRNWGLLGRVEMVRSIINNGAMRAGRALDVFGIGYFTEAQTRELRVAKGELKGMIKQIGTLVQKWGG